jgi:hypothetical protein
MWDRSLWWFGRFSHGLKASKDAILVHLMCLDQQGGDRWTSSHVLTLMQVGLKNVSQVECFIRRHAWLFDPLNKRGHRVLTFVSLVSLFDLTWSYDGAFQKLHWQERIGQHDASKALLFTRWDMASGEEPDLPFGAMRWSASPSRMKDLLLDFSAKVTIFIAARPKGPWRFLRPSITQKHGSNAMAAHGSWFPHPLRGWKVFQRSAFQSVQNYQGGCDFPPRGGQQLLWLFPAFLLSHQLPLRVALWHLGVIRSNLIHIQSCMNGNPDKPSDQLLFGNPTAGYKHTSTQAHKHCSAVPWFAEAQFISVFSGFDCVPHALPLHW